MTGWDPARTAQQRPGASVTALDFSRRQIELLRQRAPEADAHVASVIADLARRDGTQRQLEIVRTQLLPEAEDYGHLAMRLYHWSDLERLLAPYGEVVDGAAAGVLPHVPADEPEIKELLADLDAELAGDPALRGCGQHIVGVLRVA